MLNVDTRSHLQQPCDDPYRFDSNFFISEFKLVASYGMNLKINTAAVEWWAKARNKRLEGKSLRTLNQAN